MKSPGKTADVVIAGAGIAGIATAHRLAVQHGIRRVVLVDPLAPLSFTSNKSGANYRDWWPRRPMVELARRSIEIMRDLHEGAEADGAPFLMNRRGYLYVSREADFPKVVVDLLRPYREAGNEDADILLADDVQRRYPHFVEGVTGAVHARNAGTIDTIGLGRYLLMEAVGKGVRVVRGSVAAVAISGGRVASVTLTDGGATGMIATEQFINAAGPFAGHVARLVECDLRLVNVHQQKVAFADPRRVVPEDAPFTISLGPMGALPSGLHMKSDVMVGAPVIKLGCACNQEPEEPRWEPEGTESFPSRVLEAAARLVPALESYLPDNPKVLAHDVGYYTKTPDELPLIGAVGPTGSWVVGGLAGFGAMVACGAAEIVGGLITGSSPPAWSVAFRPDRRQVPEGGTGAL